MGTWMCRYDPLRMMNAHARILWLLLLLVLLQETRSEFFNLTGKNACRNFMDYYHVSGNRNCWYNPDMLMRTPELIEKYTGRVENYSVTTEDGYILSVYRLAPRQNPKGVVFLQHPLFTDSRIYMSQGNESTALLIWRAGYDVWIGNQRGTLHSEGHVNLTVTSYEYWNFSFHEVGTYDLSSMLRLVNNVTGSKIWYFGHSLGTTNALVYATMKPEESERLITTFMLASTSAYYVHSPSIVTTVVPYFEPFLTQLAETINFGNTIPLIAVVMQVSRIIFRIFPIMLWLTNLSFSFNLGWTPQEADPALLNLDAGMNIRDCSSKLGLHYLQLMRVKDRFQMFDYGRQKNRELYGSDVPSLYPIWNISVPIYFISSSDDTLTTLKDSDLLYSRLPTKAKIYKPLHISGFNHADYQIGRHRKERLVNNVLKFMERNRR